MAGKSRVTCQSCRCRNNCLGPLTFHPEVKGRLVKLSAGERRATRDPTSFCQSVTFSNRPLQVGEKVRVRVERCVDEWHGALRLGFTSVPPRLGSVCTLAIPNLTDQRGFWATLIPENHCSPRSELSFWVTRTGCLCVQTDGGFEYKKKMLHMDTSKPFWAMIDVYGQTRQVLLLGSEKKTLFSKRHSCFDPKISATEENCGYDRIPEQIQERMMQRRSLDLNRPFCERNADNDALCVVCLAEPARVYLDCGHTCLCAQCAKRVISDFGTCPLCRRSIHN